MALVVITLAVVALVVGGVFAVRSRGGPSPAADGPGGDPVQGGTLTVTAWRDPGELDPAITWDVDAWAVQRLFYETLLTYASEPGEAGTGLVPCLAEEVPGVANGGVGKGGTVYRFRLRDDARFAAPVGRAVTAADVKWSLERMLRHPLAPATSFYTGIVGAQDYLDGKSDGVRGIEVVDRRTLRITLKQPDTSFPYVLSMPFAAVMAKEWVQKSGRQIGRRPLGTGPFVLKEWAPGTRLVAVRNDDYRDDDRPYLDELRLEFGVRPAEAVKRVRDGAADLTADAVPAADLARLRDDPDWQARLVSGPQLAWYYLFMNVREEPFDDQRIRQAVNYALDRERLTGVLGGGGAALTQVYPAGMTGHQDDAVFYDRDPDKAKALLAKAGKGDGFATTLYCPDTPPFPAVAKALQTDLAAVGIKAAVRKLDAVLYWEFIALERSHAAMGLADWYADYPYPSDWVEPLFLKEAAVDGGDNVSGWFSPTVEKLHGQARREQDDTKRTALYERMQRMIMDRAPTAPLYQPLWNGLRGEHVGGAFFHPVWKLSYQDLWKTDGE